MKKESPFSKISKKDISSHTEKEPKEEIILKETTGLLKEEQTKLTESKPEISTTLQSTEIEQIQKNLYAVTEPEPEIQEAKKESFVKTEKEESKNTKQQKQAEAIINDTNIIDGKDDETREEHSRTSIEEKFAKIKKVRGVQISCYMDADISHEIDRIAEKTGTPKSQIINTLLREALFGN